MESMWQDNLFYSMCS